MRKKLSKKNKFKTLFVFILFSVILFGVSYYLYITYKNIEIFDSKYDAQKLEVSTNYSQTVEKEQEKSKSIADVLEDVTKSVCGISKLQSSGNSVLSLTTETELGLGTGIIVSSNGYILSNSHVTGEKYSTCYVSIEDKSTYRGTVVWSDTDLDLSIIKISANNLPFANLGNSKNVRIGETVYAVGNPIGFEFRKSVTSGIISAVNRTIKIEENDKTSYMSNLIQTDATINPGNSGGPLIYPDGTVVGINSVKITSAEGIGFAVPIDVVKPVITSFKENGSFDEATLGIYGYDNSVASSLRLSQDFRSGVFVDQVIKGSSCDGSGIKSGDIINKIDGISVTTINDLRRYIYTKNIGDIVTLEVLRNNKSKEFQITLKKR